MNAMTNQETDTALILEGELQRRVKEVVERVVVNIVGKVIHEELNKYKSEMMLEISISVGKMLKVIENEERKPLWEATPEEFGLTREELNTHNIGNSHAIRKQT
jgi:hypothetical protein